VKIALIGTHGTGKTTLSHELVAKLKKKGINAEFLGEVARDCPFPINEKTTVKSQEWILFNQYLREIEMEYKVDVLVGDRSIVDPYVYYVHKFGRTNWLENFVKEKAQDYKFLFKVPVNGQYLIKDGMRATNPNFQREIDETFNWLLKKIDIPYQDYKNLNKKVNMVKNAR
jgi:nicotinamide riboside kinase